MPLDSLVADSQGAIGYMIERDLRQELGRRGVAAEVVTVITEVEVDPNDPFLEWGGEEVTICKPEALVDAFEGRAGTRIRKEAVPA